MIIDLNTQAANVLISKFMDNWTDTGQEPAYYVYNHKGYQSNELKFHESWDWLMPVVDKIDKQLINGRSFIEYIDGKWWTNFQHIAYYESNISKLDSVYHAVVIYIINLKYISDDKSE
jgi:hypothetical protein